jgi:hypothetical protein
MEEIKKNTKGQTTDKKLNISDVIGSLIKKYQNVRNKNQEQFMSQYGNEYSISNSLLLEERDNCDRFIEDLKKLKKLSKNCR